MELIINEIEGYEENNKFPKLCLNMIVKNESHIIKETLTKLLKKINFDYWVISDTGSTDNTREIIKEFFIEKNIKGELFEDEWVDFGHNRTKVLEHAYQKSLYLLIFDADDEIVGDFVLPNLHKDSYLLQFGDSNGISYVRVQIVNNMKKWKYVGVLHEVITCTENSDVPQLIEGNYFTISGRTSSRNKDENKYLKDAVILEKAYEKCFETKDSLYNRYGFYCANSYFDSGKWDEAIKWYKITLNNENWSQEKYMCCLKIFQCYNNLGNKEHGFYYLIKSFEYDKERVECLYELIQHYCTNNQIELCYKFFLMVKEFYNNKYLIHGYYNKLFLDLSKPNFFLPYYMILVADKEHDYDAVIKMYIIIFTKKYKISNTFYVGNLLYNLQFFIDKTDDPNFLDLFKEYIEFLKSLNYPLHNHDFMRLYEKYGITGIFNCLKPNFTKDECEKSNKIMLYTGYSNIKWNYSYSKVNALGGSETAVIYLSHNLPKHYDIYICGDVEEESYDNIRYINLNSLKLLINSTAFNTIIVSRYLNFYEVYPNFSAYKTFIWGHDIALFPYGTNLTVHDILKKWNSSITGCICQTEWHKKLFESMYPQIRDKLHIINNGIDTRLIEENRSKNYKNKNNKNNNCKKVNNRFVYTSCSERGLERLLEIWPKILEEFSDAELYISSYNPFPNNDLERKIKIIIDEYHSIKHVGKLNKSQLYELLSSSEYWLYPTNFDETSCITSMEMLMCEVICIYYPRAGLIDTLDNYGIPVERGNEIETIMNLTTKEKQNLRDRGKKYALTCDWSNRVEQWCKVMDINIIKKNVNNVNNIKVINLKRREDRKDGMIKQFERENINNYEFIEAVDGSELKESEELRLLFDGNNFNYNKGVMGCALSHINLWNRLINDLNNDYYIILEDDIELINGFREKLKIHCKIFEEMGLEHLSLGVYDCNEEEKQKTDDITIFEKDAYKIWNISFSYIISKKAAKKIISFINKCSIKCAIDNPQSYGEVVKYHHTTHCIAKQININVFGSDIQNNDCLNFKSNNTNTNTNINQKTIKIAYCDWWYSEYCGGNFDFNDNFITNILRKYGNIHNIIVVQPYDYPDILFYSIFGSEHLNYPHPRRIFYSGEPFGIRNEANFNITFDENSDINIRFPLWLGYLNDYLLEECNRRKNGIINIPKREKFCSFISNGEVKTTHRKTIVEKLSQYKKVHCGGNYLNNIGYIVPRGINCSGKIEHNNNYKFAIAFENEDYPGYVTEKICDIYKSNCIPIYWGTKQVIKDFNPSTFINALDFKNFDELVEHIIKVDNDDELYASYFKEPFFSNKWLDVFNDPNKSFYKNLSDCILGKYNNLYDNYLSSININNSSLNKIGNLCFDIGANVGNWSLKNIKNYNTIIAVEASETTFKKLKENVSENNNIIALNFAVCDFPEEFVKFYECESDVLSSIDEKWLNGEKSRFKVNYKETFSRTITIDKLIEIYGIPDLIKIDVENAEYSCIKSLTQKCKQLCFEWASESLDITLNCLNYLYKLGFRNFFIQLNNDYYTFIPINYYDIDNAKNILINTTPKIDWGMIWAK